METGASEEHTPLARTWAGTLLTHSKTGFKSLQRIQRGYRVLHGKASSPSCEMKVAPAPARCSYHSGISEVAVAAQKADI